VTSIVEGMQQISPDELHKIEVYRDEGDTHPFGYFGIYHHDHGEMGKIDGKFTAPGHLRVSRFYLEKSYLKNRGVTPDEHYGNWWSAADVARDHAVVRGHLGVAGIRHVMRQLKDAHGIKSVSSDSRVSGTRLQGYARRHGGVPHDSTPEFATRTRQLEVADDLIQAQLRGAQ